MPRSVRLHELKSFYAREGGTCRQLVPGLGEEAERIRIAHQFDPLFAVNASIVDPLPHQVEAAYRYLLLPLPRIRFLLADDTGAGKTIMDDHLTERQREIRENLRKTLSARGSED